MSLKSLREGFHTVTPYLTVRDAEGLLTFVKQAFGATEMTRSTGSAGGLHAEVLIGNSMVMIGGGPTVNQIYLQPAALYLYLDEVDETYHRALQAGATSISEPANQAYGDRTAGIKDAFGNTWYISTPID